MTSRQFACLDCKQYIDAGYRWCYVHLERPGILIPGDPVDVEKVLAAVEYWSIPTPDQSAEWLEKLLPQVRAFLLLHRKHDLRFGEAANEHFYSGTDFLEWDDVEIGQPLAISVQTLYTKGCRDWTDVEGYMKSLRAPVWWWGQPEIVEDAQRRFAALVSRPPSQLDSPT